MCETLDSNENTYPNRKIIKSQNCLRDILSNCTGNKDFTYTKKTKKDSGFAQVFKI